ncbi:hypothetical protein SARC_12986 [Sphaeroforma arctica JP610]|uniref:Uncharacterized protein n=1 Tax=Sphaeroforma arctica JP610 TaxID=667725 RepID=A0A0L0FCJ9_9EUKA|nr:hypothetical protein SARC_12986 [Sphaeroforma arctica JP610]KNC74469.1 hypothetical protein SARC_12986 [Sphaeroforma arctica JP610]|eukprot:XP_014148371.1 hypothetical protein SARC_12986 [Sphaeroforma arctica JP610]
MIRYTFKLKVLPLDTRGVMTHLFQIFNSKPDLVVTITSNNELYFHSPEGVFSNIRIYDTGEWMDQWISFAITIQYSTNYIHLQAGKNGSNVIDTEPAILKPMSVENYYRLKYGLYYVADLVGPPTTFHVRYVDVQVEEVQSQANETVGNGTDIGTNTSTGVEETGVDVVSSQATDVGSLPIDTSSENDDDPLIDVDEIDI